MKLDYREYYYGEEYAEKSVEIPDGSRVFDLKYASIMFRVKDIEEEVYSRKYLILCNTIEGYADSELCNEFDNYFIFGDKMIIITNNSYIKEAEDLSKFPSEIFKDYTIKFFIEPKCRTVEENILMQYPYYCVHKITGISNDGFITDRIYLVNPYTFDKLVTIEEDCILKFKNCYTYPMYPEFELNKDILTFNNILTDIYDRIIDK